jgi:hypothetical protein
MKELRKREGGLIAAAKAGKPRSYAEQCEHAATRPWAVEGHEDGVSDLMGAEYQALVAKPGTVIGLGVAALCQNPKVGVPVAIGAGALTELTLFVTGHSLIAVWAAVVATAVFAVNYLLLSATVTRRHEAAREAQEALEAPSPESE